MRFGADFLTRPEQFANCCAATPWGECEVAVAAAGGSFQLCGLDSSQEGALRDLFGAHCGRTGSEPAAAPIRLRRAPGAEFCDFDPRCGEMRIDVEYLPDAVRVAGLHFVGRIECRSALAGVLWVAENAAGFATACENYLRVMAAYQALACGGVMVHSAALGDARGAVLLPGPSGAGKTTVCRLGAGRWQVLSDELNVLLADGAQARVAQLPFAGDLGSSGTRPASLPLRALCRLRKAAEEAIAPLSAGQALGLLVACAPYVNRDPYRGDQALSLLARAVARCRTFTLSFSLNGHLEGLAQIDEGPAEDAP